MGNVTNITLADRLKKIRQILCLNQKKFSEKLCIKQQNLSRYENANLDIPDSLKLKLVDIGVNMHWFFSGSGKAFMDDVANNSKEERLRNILVENKELKKIVRNLEKENTELSKELIGRLKEIVNLQKK